MALLFPPPPRFELPPPRFELFLPIWFSLLVCTQPRCVGSTTRLSTSEATTCRAREVNVNKQTHWTSPFESCAVIAAQGCYLLSQRFVQKVGARRENVSSQQLGALDVFRSTVEVMLGDGVLTREEKRLIIKLASALNLAPEEPAYIYRCIQSGEGSRSGDPVSPENLRNIYTKVFEVAIVNASLSRDEFRVLANLRNQFDIDDELHEEIEQELREMMKEKYGDKAMIDTLMDTLRDSVGMVGDLFDTFRKKSPEGDER